MGSLGSIESVAASAATEVAKTAEGGKDEAAAFLKQLSRTALTLASNSLMEAQDTMADLEDGDDES